MGTFRGYRFLVAAAVGERFIAEGALIRGGRRQSFSEAKLFSQTGPDRKLSAVATAILLTATQGESARLA
jgi:hypothetical protein